MTNITRIISLILFILVACPLTAHSSTATGIARAASTWDEFVSALRAGDMADAYSRLSPDSRKILNYRDFCVEWHPIGIKYNTVLSNPGFSNFTIYNDIATMKISMDPKLNNTGNNFIRVILERQDNKWYIIPEQLHNQVICRASITGVLEDILKESKVLNTAFKTGKGTFDDIIQELPRVFSSDRGRLAIMNYRFELDTLRDGTLRAIPRKNSAVPGYQITADGIITAFTPGRNKLISAEALAQDRERKKEARRKSMQKSTTVTPAASTGTRKIASRHSTRPEKTEPAQIIKTDLPDLPPEFPMNFAMADKPSTTTQSSKRIKYIKDEENFDLPKIDNITEIFQDNIDVKPPAIASNPAPLKPEITEEAISDSARIDNDALINELEYLVDEFASTDPAISGGIDE